MVMEVLAVRIPITGPWPARTSPSRVDVTVLQQPLQESPSSRLVHSWALSWPVAGPSFLDDHPMRLTSCTQASIALSYGGTGRSQDHTERGQAGGSVTRQRCHGYFVTSATCAHCDRLPTPLGASGTVTERQRRSHGSDNTVYEGDIPND